MERSKVGQKCRIFHIFDLVPGFPRDLLSDLVLTYFAVLGLVSQLGAQGFLNQRVDMGCQLLATTNQG